MILEVRGAKGPGDLIQQASLTHGLKPLDGRSQASDFWVGLDAYGPERTCIEATADLKPTEDILFFHSSADHGFLEVGCMLNR